MDRVERLRRRQISDANISAATPDGKEILLIEDGVVLRSNGEFIVRQLSQNFIQELKIGILERVLKRVTSDNTLDLQIRNDYVNIYYRGGNIMEIVRLGEKIFKFSFNKEYAGAKDNLKLPHESDMEGWVKIIPVLKEKMDRYFTKNRKNEREFQQLLVRENNYSNVVTDYFIVDIEYATKNGARFDALAFEWQSEAKCRKLQKGYKPTLNCIEMKYGDHALDGKSGIVKHIEKFADYVMCNKNCQKLKSEMIEIFKQKRELGLIPGLRCNENVVKELSECVNLVFLLVNHDPASSKLGKILDDAEEIQKMSGFNIKFASSNFMGYGLYKENIFSLKEFRERFTKQILCS